MKDENTNAQQAMATQLSGSVRLPSPSAIALRLITLAQDPQANMAQVAELVQCDPALTSKLLRLANSPLYGYCATVTTLSKALQILGLNAAIALALSFSLHDELDTDAAGGLDIKRYWQRSLLTALAARGLAIEWGETQPETFFLAGLLREIGLLAMNAALGERWANIYRHSDDHADLRYRETQEMGFNYVEAGAWLLRQWQLPAYLSTGLAGSHLALLPETKPVGKADQLATAVAVAAHMAEAWLAGDDIDALYAKVESSAPWLALEAAKYSRMIAGLMAQIPWIETCFEIQLMDAAQRRAVEDNAQEIVIARTLLCLRTTDELEQRTRALERRTDGLDARAQRDSMTGLFNREHFVTMLDKAFTQASHEGAPLSVAFIDIDRFKAINDTYGHAAGDSVIIGIARRLLLSVRQTDVVARYGGEEFVILLGATGLDASRRIIQRLLSNIRSHSFRLPNDNHLNVTVSIGIATHAPAGSAFHNPQALLESADQAMYAAKRGGRDQVIHTAKPLL